MARAREIAEVLGVGIGGRGGVFYFIVSASNITLTLEEHLQATTHSSLLSIARFAC